MLPNDPIILLSVVNTRLRDFYSSLEEFCSAEDISPEDLEKRLAAAGFCYDREQNRFI